MAYAIRRTYRDKQGRKCRCRTYTVVWQDAGGQWNREPTKYTDKQAAEDLGNRLERESAQGLEGRRDLYAEHKAAPLSQHLADWLVDLETAGRDGMYVYNCRKRMEKLAEKCQWARLANLTADSFVKWRTAAKDKTHGPATLNQYLDTARAFLGWCVRQKRLPENPLAVVGKMDTAGDVRRKRRALTEAELRRLLAKAPEDRRLVYLFAASTGLRRSEIAALRWDDLHLTATKPYVQLRAEATKARRADRVPLRQDVAAILRPMQPADETAPVFATVPSIYLYKADLAAAGIPFLDSQKRRADFHALRFSFATMLAQGGVVPRVAMELMRHTDMRLTQVVYTDPDGLATADAVESLPDLTKPAGQKGEAQAAEAVATGTDGLASLAPDRLTHPLTHENDFSRPVVSCQGAVDRAEGEPEAASAEGAESSISASKDGPIGADGLVMACVGANENPTSSAGSSQAGELGFEPRLTDPES